MIQTVVRREYRIACDGCGHHGPALSSSDLANQAARSQGWNAVAAYCAVGPLTTWYCPDCQGHRQNNAE
jgi:hypothetical protein